MVIVHRKYRIVMGACFAINTSGGGDYGWLRERNVLVLSCLVSLECTLWEGFFWRMPKQAYTVPCRASHPRLVLSCFLKSASSGRPFSGACRSRPTLYRAEKGLHCTVQSITPLSCLVLFLKSAPSGRAFSGACRSRPTLYRAEHHTPVLSCLVS